MRIKTYALMMMALLVSLISTAQKKQFTFDKQSLSAKQSVSLKQNLKALATPRMVSTATPFAVKSPNMRMVKPNANAKKQISMAPAKAPAVVTPPEEGEVEYYTLTGDYYRYDGNEGDFVSVGTVSRTVNVVWDGENDVYISGLCHYATDAYVKGTFVDDTHVVFEKGQYLGNVGKDVYMAGESTESDDYVDVAATYDPDANSFTFTTIISTVNAEMTGAYAYGANVVVAASEDVELPVVPPTDLVTENYVLSGKDYRNNDAPVSCTIKVGIYNEEIYIQGLGGSLLPDAWVKGTIEDNVITLPAGQFLGSYAGAYNFYFLGINPSTYKYEDITLVYDAESGSYMADNWFTSYTPDAGQSGYYDYIYTSVTWVKITEKAATPATPAIDHLKFEPGSAGIYNIIEYNVPVVDVDGNGMITDKLSFKIFYKDETGVAQPLTFTKEMYTKLEEDMTEVPYGFLDKYDFIDGGFYLNMDISTWKEMGIQSVYRGGNAVNESEISWYVLPQLIETSLPSGLTVTSNDFTGKILDTDTYEFVDAAKKVNIALDGNDIYIQGLADAEGLAEAWIKGTKNADGKYVFKAGQYLGADSYDAYIFIGYDEANQTIADAVLSVDAESGVYKFDTQFIVNASYIDRLYFSTRYASESTIAIQGVVETVVTPPAEMLEENYLFTGTSSGNAVSHAVKVGFVGNDVYVQGLSETLPEAWVMGTKDESNNITFAAGQWMGTYTYMGTDYKLYFMGVKGKNVLDYVCTYDAETGTITGPDGVNLGINMYKAKIDQSLFESYKAVTLTKVTEKAVKPANPTMGHMAFNKFGAVANFTIPLTDVNGEALVADKLSYQLFYKDAADNVVPFKFTTALYEKLTADMEIIPYGFTDEWDIYTDGAYIYADKTNWKEIGIQTIYTGGGETNKSDIVWQSIILPIDAVTPSEGLAVTEHEFAGATLNMKTGKTTNFTSKVNLAVSETEMYIQGLNPADQTAWVKGVKEGDSYVFKCGQDMGVYTSGTSSYRVFFLGANASTGNAENFKLTLNTESNTYVFENIAVISANYTDVVSQTLRVYVPGCAINVNTTTGIESVKAEKFDVNAPAYNMAGQRVNKGFKGLIIKGGKKFVNK